MEILVRNSSTHGWHRVKEENFENEAALQNILYESPEIIPLEKLGENWIKPKLFIKEAGLPGSGNTDLIGIDEEGGITIIECKLATKSDVRRKVIGQLLEYAAYLWQMPYEEFDKICSKAEGWGDKRLTDVMRGKME
jgi:RecB family endonuclease NucS